MKISDVIAELQHIEKTYGDIEVHLQNNPSDPPELMSHEFFYIVAEQYEDGMYCNLRSWPY